MCSSTLWGLEQPKKQIAIHPNPSLIEWVRSVGDIAECTLVQLERIWRDKFAQCRYGSSRGLPCIREDIWTHFSCSSKLPDAMLCCRTHRAGWPPPWELSALSCQNAIKLRKELNPTICKNSFLLFQTCRDILTNQLDWNSHRNICWMHNQWQWQGPKLTDCQAPFPHLAQIFPVPVNG